MFWPRQNWGHFIESIFKLIFLNVDFIILIQIYLKLSSGTFDNKCSSIVLDNGLAPNRQQKAVIWTRIWIHHGLIYWRICVTRPPRVNNISSWFLSFDVANDTLLGTEIANMSLPVPMMTLMHMISTPLTWLSLNGLKCHFADIFKWIFITEKMCFWVQFHRSKFLMVQLTSYVLVQAMA